MNKKIFQKFSDYYELLYHDKDYAAEAEYIDNLIIRNGKNLKKILEFGSGTGKHANILSKLGYTIHGIELSEHMVSKTKIVPGFTCQQGDITNIKMNKKYDVILSLFHVMSYQITEMQLNNVFSNAADHLNKDGLFIFDFWYSPAVNSQKPSIRVKRISNKKIEITRIAEPEIISDKNLVKINYNIFVKNLADGKIENFNEVHTVKHFSIIEIDNVSKKFGFERLILEEFKTGKKINDNIWGPCVVLKKIR